MSTKAEQVRALRYLGLDTVADDVDEGAPVDLIVDRLYELQREGFSGIASAIRVVQGEDVSTIPAVYVGEAMRSRIGEIGQLLDVVGGRADLLDERDLVALDVGAVFDDHELQNDGGELVESAEARLDEYPLAVERSVAFEVVIGTGGPDDRIVVECDVYSAGESHGETDLWAYEPRRVLYRYSWEGSAEVELRGDEREVALLFARRHVPELAE